MSEDNSDNNPKISKKDAELWRVMTKDVDLFEGAAYQDGVENESKNTEEAIIRETVIFPAKKEKPSAQSGNQLDGKTAEKLRLGKINIEARLDLHGMYQEEAHTALHDFVIQSHARGLRCILVITGKGRDKPSVLKRNVPHWLDHAALRPIILQTVPAHQKDGGDGALYVYLRRQR